VGLVGQRRHEVRQPVVVDRSPDRDQHVRDGSGRVRQQDRGRVHLRGDPLYRLLAVVGEHHPRFGVAAGEHRGDVVDRRPGPLLELHARLLGRRLFGENVIAEHDHPCRREKRHQGIGEGAAFGYFDRHEYHGWLPERDPGGAVAVRFLRAPPGWAVASALSTPSSLVSGPPLSRTSLA
jgi:hypothetical protein